MQLIRIGDGDLVVVVDVDAPVPTIVHWGADPGRPDGVAPLLDRGTPPSTLEPGDLPHGALGVPLVPLRSTGDDGRPGLAGHRRGREHEVVSFGRCDWDAPDDRTLRWRTSSGDLELAGEVSIVDTVVLRVRLTNLAPSPFVLDRLCVSLPVPAGADEILRLGGHWAKELTPIRSTWEHGTQVIENRRGRTSHDHVPLLFTGRRGFGEESGSVHGVHVAWSGNSQVRAELLTDGRRAVQAGELLESGEVVLGEGEAYEAPVVHATWGEGLVQASRRYHRTVRTGQPDRPRPVLLNTWEAVYFDHDLDTLRALADRAASVGVERFVLDDGWFGGRRDDRAGLGDWWVSPDAHPDGLGPLISHVTGLGMEFGIWVEPEMVNPDSDLYRAHAEWVLGDPDVLGRNQLVLDLSIDECRAHLRTQLDALLADHDIAFVKWDMNRDLAGAGAHAQTLALYALLDDLASAHPDVEFESCSSGGGRIDLGILGRTQRVWTSDCNDALDRQTIQRGASYLVPPSVMGAHIGPPRAHTTGRTQRLHFRAATAMFGHLGIEWNLLEAEDRHLDALRWWIAAHKERRPLLHGGDVVRVDVDDPAGLGHGVVSADRSSALFCWAQLTQSVRSLPPRLRLVGLDAGRDYEVRHLAAPGEVLGLARPPRWMTAGPVVASGRWLGEVGVQLPLLHPESAVLVEALATTPADADHSREANR